MTLEFSDPRQNPAAWARALGVSREAIEIFASSDSIDLHIESFIWSRMTGYDLARRHGQGLLGARFYSQVDLPRLLESGMTGSVWSVATNPLRRASRRTAVLLDNLQRLNAIITAHADHFALVTNVAGYQQARAAGKHACWLAIQGGNALGGGAADLDRLPRDAVSRITLVHLTNSPLGATSSPLGGETSEGLTGAGRDLVREMNRRRILVDLAHISPGSFQEALEVHDPSLPPIVSHTGVRAVHDCWRNLDDEQLRAIAHRGGVVGIIFHTYFLNGSFLDGDAALVLDHLEHVVRVAGEDCAVLGSDWDGMITTPRDMRTVLELPVLVQRMLERGWSAERIQKVLGRNYLRVIDQLRPS